MTAFTNNTRAGAIEPTVSSTGNPSTKPKISVCIVTYNQERYIRDCLDSVVSQQTAYEVEVIIGDDCSTDNTRAIINEYAERNPSLIRCLFHPANMGATKNFLAVHNAARGDFVAHLDGDDLMLPGKLEQQARFLDEHPDFSVVWHPVDLFDDKGGFFSGHKYDYSFLPDGVISLDEALRLGSIGAHSSCMYRSSARVTREADGVLLDLFFAWEYLSHGRGKMLNDVLGAYRVAAHGSILSSWNIRELNAEHARYYLKRFPEQRPNIFVFSILNFLIDAKNRRPTAKLFLALMRSTVCLISPSVLYRALVNVRKLVSHPLSYEPRNQN